jgi:hypothetical protein
MLLLETISVEHGGHTRRIELHHGDLSAIPLTEAVDLLVVSAYPNDYAPTPASLIGALHRRGLSVHELAQRKHVDLRNAFSCWLSHDIGDLRDRFGFRRVLCFEPRVRGAPAEVVGEIFQALMPFAYGDPPIKTVAMPLVASGEQRVPIEEMLPPLLDAATHWLALGLPIDRLMIVEASEARAGELARRFADFGCDLAPPALEAERRFSYDVFVSYSQQNCDAVDFMVAELRRRKPDVRVFLDRQGIDVGHGWQQVIFEALDDCRMVVAVYSPPYLRSKVCKEEFNIALFRHRESEAGLLVPVYLASTELPTYMKLVQYIDCRESDHARLAEACGEIVRRLEEDA